MREVVIAFDKTIDAIRAEKALEEAGLCPLVMPLPSAIRAGCGLCLRVGPEVAAQARQALGAAGISGQWYVREALAGCSRYEPIKEDDR